MQKLRMDVVGKYGEGVCCWVCGGGIGEDSRVGGFWDECKFVRIQWQVIEEVDLDYVFLYGTVSLDSRTTSVLLALDRRGRRGGWTCLGSMGGGCWEECGGGRGEDSRADWFHCKHIHFLCQVIEYSL